MSKSSSAASASVKFNTALQTLQDLLHAFQQNQGLSLSSAFPILGTRTETVSSQPEERLFNGRLAFQELREFETQGTAVVSLPQQKGEGVVQLLEIQNESAVTIAVTNETAIQEQQTILLVPPSNKPGVQGAGTLVVTTLVDENDGGFGGTGLSLREAILMASDGDTIIFDPSLNNGTTTDGVISLSVR